MTRRIALIVAALVVVAIGAGLWRRASVPSSSPATTPTAAAPLPEFALHLELVASAPGEDAAAIVRLSDAGAIRRAALERSEKANGRTWKGSSRARIAATPTATPPADWATRVELMSPGSNTRVAASAMPGLEPNSAVFAITLPADGAVEAALVIDGRTMRSRAAPLPNGPRDAATVTIARGSVAEVLGRSDGLRSASAALLRTDARSAWGHYFNGAALEMAGDRAGAAAAFTQALQSSPRGSEPPLALLARIERLRK